MSRGKLGGVKSARWLLVAGIACLLTLLAFWIFSPPEGGLSSSNSTVGRSTVPRTEPIPEVSEDDPGRAGEEPVVHPPDPVLRTELLALQQKLAARPGREAALWLLQEFFARWLKADPDRAAATLREFLRSGGDQATELGFVVGEAGLEEWPSLRAFLLDLLGKIDPELASRYALETVIPAKNSTVEYAVSLQILWNHGGAEEPTPELTEAWLGLLQKQDWSARPDAAWLESLDFASRIPAAASAFLQSSTAWLAQPAEVPARVAAVDLALERMAEREPVATMGALVGNPGLLGEGRGRYQRPQIFARADLTDPEQQRLLARYLEGLDSRSPEARFFFQSFPCHNFSVGPSLSGQPRLASAMEIMEGDRAALRWLESGQTSSWARRHAESVAELLEKMRKIVQEQ
jgi:hypothetical protein